MKDFESLHQKVQEMCDCHVSSDPLKEMSEIPSEKDVKEAAVKWIALAALHGINNSAKKITLYRSGDGKVKATAEYRDADLPNPGEAVANAVIDGLKEITHIEEKKGSMPLALGIRDSSLELTVKVKSEKDGETISIKFPK